MSSYPKIQIYKNFLVVIPSSNYKCKENGITKISKKEWDKIAKVLEVDFEEIYEPEDGVYVFNNSNSTGNFGQAQNNIFNNFSEFAVETMKEYIEKLEQESQNLTEENQLLKEKI